MRGECSNFFSFHIEISPRWTPPKNYGLHFFFHNPDRINRNRKECDQIKGLIFSTSNIYFIIINVRCQAECQARIALIPCSGFSAWICFYNELYPHNLPMKTPRCTLSSFSSVSTFSVYFIVPISGLH